MRCPGPLDSIGRPTGKKPNKALRGQTRCFDCATKEAFAYQRKCGRPKETVVKKSGRVVLGVREMAALRYRIWERSGGQCERIDEDDVRCPNMFGWSSMHLHHIIYRSQGGSDSEENCAGWCQPCHKTEHNQ